MTEVVEAQKDRLNAHIEAVRQSSPMTRERKLQQLLSQVDALTRKQDGLAYCYEKVEELVDLGIFDNTPWAQAEHLVPSLVGGTLQAGFPNNVLEILSELRMLRIAVGDTQHPTLSANEAKAFLEEMIIANFNLAFLSYSEEARLHISAAEQRRIQALFAFLLKTFPLEQLKPALLSEVKAIAAQRSIMTTRLEEILALVKDHLPLDSNEPEDAPLLQFIAARYHPTLATHEAKNQEAYRQWLEAQETSVLREEFRQMGRQMQNTGLVSPFQVTAAHFIVQRDTTWLADLLALNSHGKADLKSHISFITRLVTDFITPFNREALFGLARLLERNMLSRKPVWYALNKLVNINLHPGAAAKLMKVIPEEEKTTPLQLLVGGTLQVLGQPLGIGQGNNPTCQSARGISMWSQHAPGKLLNYIIDAATSDNLYFRYEGELLEASKLSIGTATTFDYKLDPVSIILVPLLDRIYNEMMRLAMVKHFTEDPHVSVNPAFYGHWIQTGFASAYDPLQHAIVNYDRFLRLFIASFHPEFNGGHQFIYPVPLGIFVTSARGEFVGFHAISLQRVAQAADHSWRAYIYNPNNEGRQNWGQDIRPAVTGHGELPGESSLPFHQLLSRVYAFHYNTIGVDDRLQAVDDELVEKTRVLAKNSWGLKYIWI